MINEQQYKSYTLPQYPGISFVARYDQPSKYAHTAKPYRGRIGVRVATRKKLLTKREFDGRPDDGTYEVTLRGTNPEDIYHNQIPTQATKIAQMLPPHLTGQTYAKPLRQPLDKVLAEHMEDIFKEFYPRIAQSTYRHYTGQYQFLLAACAGVDAADLNSEAYAALQDRIIAAANDTRRKATVKGKPSSSAQTRLSLLCNAILYLKARYGSDFIPVTPTVPKRKNPRSAEIMDLMDTARCFPRASHEVLQEELNENAGAISLSGSIEKDTGCRISEACGLVWSDLKKLYGSQGPMYFICISGQLDHDGKRTEIPKTVNAYRYLPLARRLGEILESRHHTAAGTLILADLLAEETGEPLDESPRAMKALRDRLEEYHKALFNMPAVREAFLADRAYIAPEKVIPKAVQDEHLIASLTSHLCRRNYCTELYCCGGVYEDFIRRMMGHELENKGEMARNHPLTEGELYSLALIHQTTSGVYRTGNTLQYSVDNEYSHAEIPVCRCQLLIPAGQKVRITVFSREPFTKISVQSFHSRVEEQQTITLPAATIKDKPVVLPPDIHLKPAGTIFDCLLGDKEKD